uniref:Sulfotransferase domain-containing protein n=1 Tax=Odontella aurita TaxID=265563 RepID=A0A7S4J0P6_9STRA
MSNASRAPAPVGRGGLRRGSAGTGPGKGGVMAAMQRGFSVGAGLGGGARRGSGGISMGSGGVVGPRRGALGPGGATASIVSSKKAGDGDHKTIYSAPGVLDKNKAGAELPMAAPSNPQGPNGNGSFDDEPHIPMSSAAAAIMMAANRKVPSERSSQDGGSDTLSNGGRRLSETLHTEPLPKHSRWSTRRLLLFGSGVGQGRGRCGSNFRERAYGVSVAVLCFLVSILVAAFYGQGRLGRGAGGVAYKGLRPEDRARGVPAAKTGAKLPPVPDLASMNIAISPALENNFAETSAPFPKGTREHLALFWQIPRSGGNAVKAVLGRCRGLVEASELASTKGNEGTLKIYETTQGTKFVNVDPTTPEGIQHGIDLRVASAKIADIAFTPLIHDVTGMFAPSNPGRVLAVFRHPVDRAASQFHHDRTVDPTLADVSLADYVMRGLAADNWMTRALVNKEEAEVLTDDDLFAALEVLRRKVLVGLSDRVVESLERFEAYFGWDALGLGGDADAVAGCQQSLLAEAGDVHAPGVVERSEGWVLLMERNRFDMRVYEYARYLYSVQGTRL